MSRRYRLALTLLTAALASLARPAASAPRPLMMLVSNDQALVQRTADAVAAAAAAATTAIPLERVELRGSVDAGRAALARRDRGVTIIAVGGEAALACVRAGTSLPVRFALVPDRAAEVMMRLPDARGIFAVPDSREVLERIRRHLPDVRRIGVPHDPAAAAERVTAATAIAEELGLKIVPMIVRTRTDVPDAYRAARAGIEAVWLMPDAGAALADATALEYLRSEILLDRLPLIAQEAALRTKGAVLTVEGSPAALGAHLVRLALDPGTDAARVTPTDGAEVHVMKWLADRIGVAVRGGDGAVVHP